MIKKSSIRLTLLALAAALGGAQALANAQEPDPTQELRDQARKFWEARVKDDWVAVHDQLPDAERNLMPGDKFAARQKESGPFRYLSADVGEAYVEKDIGWVHVKFSVTARQFEGMPPQQQDIWDLWQKSDVWRPVERALLEEYPTRPPSVRPAEEEALVAKRVATYWDAMARNDRKTLYDMISPAARQAIPVDEFNSLPAKYIYLTHAIEWVEVTDDSARAKVSYKRKINDPSVSKMDPIERADLESWVKVDGEWYRSVKPAAGSQ